ncbi:DNA polymerase III subunit gamma/tau [Kamptonema cortianum]|nr:DNA polymerase III subunit gamma/tau [Geitlerinema splendidum]MDK3157681.1 DNA polymerase III subunit gamma/tau [Kamptonema cortianum]
MGYVALYRKYRSQSFEDLVGQEHVVRTLRNAISQGKISHAYLFTGPRGTGKTSTARLLAKALNCTGGPSADIPADCPICAEITAGSCMDVIELDAASESGVDDVRDHIVEASEYEPASCRYRIFIIDEVHDLSSKAFDALLKTIEEPPAHVVFVLATTEYQKIPPTIRSRCQKFEFHRGTVTDLTNRLQYVVDQEGVEADPSALVTIARLADGGYRDALTLLEQALLTSDGKLSLEHVYEQLGLVDDEMADELLTAVSESNAAQIIEKLERIYQRGRDPQSIVESLMHRLADLTRAVLGVETGGSNDAAVEAGLTASASRLGLATLTAIRSELSRSHAEVRHVTLPRLWLESELIRIGISLHVPVPDKAVQPAVKAEKTDVTAKQKQASPPSPSVQSAAPGTAEVAVRPETSAVGNWRAVVETISKISKTAAARLPASRVLEEHGNVVTIEFKRMSDVEWVESKPDLYKTLVKKWEEISGSGVEFKFVSASKAPASAPKIVEASVESPLEGERLHQKGVEILDIQEPSKPS